MQEFIRKYCHQTKRPSVSALFVCIDFGQNDPGPKRLIPKIGLYDPPTKAKRPSPKIGRNDPGQNDPAEMTRGLKRPGFLAKGLFYSATVQSGKIVYARRWSLL